MAGNDQGTGETVCKRYLLDYDRDLARVAESVLDEGNPVVDFCIPAPGGCRITLEPETRPGT